MSKQEQIKEALENLSIRELVSVHNEYCEAAGYMDDWIYSIEEFDEIMNGQTPWEIARCAYYGDFCPAHDYFWFNGYANLESSDFPTGQIDIDRIAEYMLDNDTGLYCDEVERIMEAAQCSF